MTNKRALKVLSSWLQVAYQNADGTDESSAELYEALQTVFDLINRQKEEIERLKSMNQAKLDTIHDLQAEIERLKDYPYTTQIEVSKKLESQIKFEAITEFAEKLKEKADIEIAEEYLPSGERYQLEYKTVTIEDIDDLVKEMTNVIS